jgi:hypothetical protein
MTAMTADIEQKLTAYREFWSGASRKRPLIGIDAGGWFPFKRFSCLRKIEDGDEIRRDLLSPQDSRQDYEEYLQYTGRIEDDLISGAAPIPAVPWMEAVLGARLVRNKDGVWAEERGLSWEAIEALKDETDPPWQETYLAFVRELADLSGGRFPVGLPILRGVADLLGMLRGHTTALIDCMEEPDKVRSASELCADSLIRLVSRHHEVAGDFFGGHFIEQYGVWAPGPLVRMQEDESAVYSPRLYEEIILEQDRKIARAFPYSLIHLHTSSLFLLESFLSIREIDVFEINKDICEMGIPEMLPYLKRIQADGRRLFIRGPLTKDDFILIQRHLAPEGLILQTVVDNEAEASDILGSFRTLYQG